MRGVGVASFAAKSRWGFIGVAVCMAGAPVAEVGKITAWAAEGGGYA